VLTGKEGRGIQNSNLPATSCNAFDRLAGDDPALGVKLC
jgi:hypothetical protein